MRCACAVLAVLAFACGKKDRSDQVAPADPAPAAKAPAPAPAPSNADEATKAFWTWFSQHAAELRADKNIQATMETISAEVAKVNPDVFAEIGVNGDNRTLVLSVDGKKDLFPAVERIHAARPEVPGWTIVAFRQRDTGFRIEMNGKKVEPASVKFVARPHGDKLDVDVYMPAVGDRDQMAQLGFVMLDHAVGEYDMEMKIGGLEFLPIAKAPADARPLSELAAAVDATK